MWLEIQMLQKKLTDFIVSQLVHMAGSSEVQVTTEISVFQLNKTFYLYFINNIQKVPLTHRYSDLFNLML